ncbi:MAG: phosphomannomutase/phosphoglucomutase [Piscirickettsiaceae bacterium]|nr:phosphomannomutase/phosphoglucomutase [Piscirickettsiaceae bacterium]
MKRLAKIGNKPVAILTLIISCVVVIVGFIWQQQLFNNQGQGQQDQQHQQVATMIHHAISSRVTLLNQQMETVASSPNLAGLILSGDMEAVVAQQEMLASLFPNAQKVCLFSANIDQPDENACLPITFASLNSLRLAKENGSAPMALMQAGKDNAHLLLAHRVMGSNEQVAGVLVVAFNPDEVSKLLFKEYGANGYVELRQGVKKTAVVAKQGNGQWKQGPSSFDKPIANSYWRIAYWPAGTAESSSLLMVILSAMLGVMIVMWLLREFWQQSLLKRDVTTLQQQIEDIKENKLKSKYFLTNAGLQKVASDLIAMVKDMASSSLGSPPNKAATLGNIKPQMQMEPILETENTESKIEQKMPRQPISEFPPVDVKPTPIRVPVVENDITEKSSGLTFSETPVTLEVIESEPVVEEPVVDEAPLEFNILEPLILEIDEEATLEIDRRIFKAYDIRGIVGQTLNENIVRKIGQAIGSEALEQGQSRLVIGRDGRHSSPSLSNALIEGILASGCDAVDIGMVPTPVLYFACHQLGTHSGVMVTGSHNPADYNGLKIMLADKSLSGDELQALYQRIKQDDLSTGQGHQNNADVIDDYIAKIVGDVSTSRSIKVVIDSGNGVAGIVAPKLLIALGCEVIALYSDVDGDFPNHHPDPSKPENLQALIAKVKESGAELGIAFDGDADRLGVVDINGKAIWPDRLMTLFAQDVLSRQQGATIIYDVKSTSLLENIIKKSGGEPLMWKSGHSLIKNKMQETGAQLAGEMSGHIFFKERWFGFDDGLYSACRLLEILAKDTLARTPTEVFAAIPDRINTPEIIIEMDDAESHRLMEQLSEEAQFGGATLIKIDGVRAEYPNGWGLVRASNTVPGITLRFEAETEEGLQQIQQQFKQQLLQIKPTLTLLF